MSIRRIRVTMDDFHFGRAADLENGPLECRVEIEQFGKKIITSTEILHLDIWRSAFDHIWEKLGRDIKRYVEEESTKEPTP